MIQVRKAAPETTARAVSIWHYRLQRLHEADEDLLHRLMPDHLRANRQWRLPSAAIATQLVSRVRGRACRCSPARQARMTLDNRHSGQPSAALMGSNSMLYAIVTPIVVFPACAGSVLLHHSTDRRPPAAHRGSDLERGPGHHRRLLGGEHDGRALYSTWRRVPRHDDRLAPAQSAHSAAEAVQGPPANPTALVLPRPQPVLRGRLARDRKQLFASRQTKASTAISTGD
jgi:hypothetical protein